MKGKRERERKKKRRIRNKKESRRCRRILDKKKKIANNVSMKPKWKRKDSLIVKKD